MNKKSMICSLLIGCSALVFSVAFAVTTKLTQSSFEPVNADECSHSHVEHYIGHSDTITGSGYVEHWACCKCHTAWADENRLVVIGSTQTERNKIDIDVGFKPDWGSRPMLSPTYDSENDRVLYIDSNFYIRESVGVTPEGKPDDPYGFIETITESEIEGYESVKLHILNNTSATLLNMSFINSGPWTDLGFGTLSFEKGVEKIVEFTDVQWNIKPAIIIKDPLQKEVTGSLTLSFEIISKLPDINNVISAINELPNVNDYTMPNDVYVLNNLRRVETLYNSLDNYSKPYVTNYDKLEANLNKCELYDVVYKMDSSASVSVIPSYVPNFVSTSGGSASFGSAYVGNYIDVTSNDDGRAALDFTNFSCGGYQTLYFYVKVSVACSIYLSDGTANDGWGADWKNNSASMGSDHPEFYCDKDTWKQITVDVSTGIFKSNWSLGFWTDKQGFTFQISNIYGFRPAEVELPYYFGQRTATDETYQSFGTVYNLIQEQWFITDDPNPGTIASAGMGVLRSALPEGYSKLIFAIYNPNESNSTFHISGGDALIWLDGDNTVLAPKAWTVVEIKEKEFAINDTYTTYFYANNANTAGWKITAIFASK